MSRGDLLISMISSVCRGDHDGFIEDCQALIVYEESKKNYGIAGKIRKVLEGRVKESKPVASSFSIEPIDTKRISRPTHSQIPELITIEKSFTNLSQVILSKSTKDAVENLVEQWQCRDRLMQYNLTPQNRLLFSGLPGTGKTFTAYAIANSLGLDIAYVRFDSLVSSYLGQTGSNLREVFEFASKRPCLLLLDEVDAIGKKRDDNQELGELKRIVISLLQNLDLFPAGSLLIACTNHPQLLDDALWRRFNCVISFEMPEKEQRKTILESRLLERNVKVEVNWLTFWADITEGLSPANLVQTVDNGIRKWVVKNDLNPYLFITEEIVSQLQMEKTDENKRINIAEKLRNQSRSYSFSYLSSLLSIPKSTLHKRLKEKEDKLEG